MSTHYIIAPNLIKLKDTFATILQTIRKLPPNIHPIEREGGWRNSHSHKRNNCSFWLQWE